VRKFASPGGKKHAARRFLKETQKHTAKHMHRLTALKARQAISGKFPETLNYEFIQRKHEIV